jgi:nudix-type nucleoside diphosphatase (YffH/AdpP family)
MSIAHRVRIEESRLLSDNWYILKTIRFAFQRADGSWQTQNREVYDRGNGATLLLYNLEKRSLVLTRQFRMPAFANGYDELLIETPAGLLDEDTPENRVRAEVEEETGYRISAPQKVFEAFMSPGSVTEKLAFLHRPLHRP